MARKKLYFIDQTLSFMATNKERGFTNYFTYRKDNIVNPESFSIYEDELKCLCEIMNCNSAEELNEKDVTTVVKIIYGSYMEWPCIVAVGKDGYFVQLHNRTKSKDGVFSKLYTKNPEVKIEKEEDLIETEYKSYNIERVPMILQSKKRKTKAKKN